MVCFRNLIALSRKEGYLYQYVQVLDQELQGYLDIEEEVDVNSKKSVIGGNCQDFFEFREVSYPIVNEW